MAFDILHEFSDNITLMQLMDTSGNFNHVVSVSGYWVFGSNYKQALPQLKELLGTICTPYREEAGVFAEFQDELYAVRFEITQTKFTKWN